MKRLTDDKSLKYMKILAVFLLICAVALSGCVEEGQNNTDTEPANNTSEDQNTSGEGYVYGTANVDSVQIMILESFPVQIQVVAEGYLPDGCTEIDKITTEREENTFNVNITTKRPKDAICTQAIVPFNETIPLEAQGLKAGNYTVNVNGITGSFELTVDNTLDESPSSMPPKQQVITEAGNGTTINLENEETFYLRLEENPSTGYSWQINLSEGLSLLSDKYYSSESSAERQQPLVGAGGVHLWEIKANSEGSQQVNGIYKRSWEKTTGTEENFTLNVEVI
jgi:inhibitor of cysteine peptidase